MRTPEHTEADAGPASGGVGTDPTRVEGQWARPVAAWTRRHLPIIAPILVYLLLVLAGVTTSSIGVAAMRQDPAAPLGLQIGSALEIRSDEYLTESPLWLGQMAVGTSDLPNLLGISPDFFAQLPAGPVSAVVFLDGSLLMLAPWLPDAMLFAAKWWLPTLLLVIGLPLWFRRVTGSLRWGYLAALLIVVSPSNVWWSGRPINTLGFLSAGCALAIWGIVKLEAGRRWFGLLGILGAGILLARYPTYYQPLAIMIGLPIVLATLAFLLARAGAMGAKLAGVGALVLSGLAWTGALIWESRDSIAAGLDTVYPGGRASTSGSLTIGRIFGATNMGWLKTVGDAMEQGQNKTEIAQSFTVLLVVVAVMLASRRWAGGRVLAWTTAPVVALGAFWLIWGTVYLGDLGALLPLVNRVPGFRASNGAGFIAILAFCLVLAQWQESRVRRAPIVAGILVAFLSAWAGSSLQADYLPALTGKMIWISAAVSGMLVFALLRWPQRWQPLAATAVVGALISFSTNPILFGLADLRASDTAKLFLEEGTEARRNGELWASDAKAVDSLFLATGTPSLSTRQQIGPDAEAWERLDPHEQYENMWNRGGTFIGFVWTDEPELTFSLPVQDTVLISGSPCAVVERFPELTAISSGVELEADCLVADGDFEWSGATHHIYRVVRP